METIIYQKILVTHDGSDLASSAMPHAFALAKSFNAEVVMLHVVRSVDQEIAMMSSPGVGIYPAPIGGNAIEVVKENRKFAKRQLESFKTDFEKGGVKNVKVLVKEGSDQDEILNTAKEDNCDLIVMSTHGRSGFKRAILGSVAEYVIRHSPCPVFVVHPAEGVNE